MNEYKTERIEATPNTRGWCEGCGEQLVSKCGTIKMWHWAHAPDSECVFATAPETHWHRRWKKTFPKENVEVIIGAKRADIYINGLVIELQNSSISVPEIQDREQHYKDMVWVVNGEHFEDNFDLREKDAYYTFRWKWSRRIWQKATKPVYIDFHDKTLLLVKKLYDKGGWGVLFKKQDFLGSCGIVLRGDLP
ncbi:MAG: competence protein CoiA [Actinobacteria bacterium]|nr:competence protein CoiA [Actinomycetota bacterium]